MEKDLDYGEIVYQVVDEEIVKSVKKNGKVKLIAKCITIAIIVLLVVEIVVNGFVVNPALVTFMFLSGLVWFVAWISTPEKESYLESFCLYEKGFSINSEENIKIHFDTIEKIDKLYFAETDTQDTVVVTKSDKTINVNTKINCNNGKEEEFCENLRDSFEKYNKNKKDIVKKDLEDNLEDNLENNLDYGEVVYQIVDEKTVKKVKEDGIIRPVFKVFFVISFVLFIRTNIFQLRLYSHFADTGFGIYSVLSGIVWFVAWRSETKKVSNLESFCLYERGFSINSENNIKIHFDTVEKIVRGYDEQTDNRDVLVVTKSGEKINVNLEIKCDNYKERDFCRKLRESFAEYEKKEVVK